MCRLKGYDLWASLVWKHFPHFDLESGVVFEETTVVYMYLSFQFQMSKNEIGMCEFEMHLKNAHLNCKGPQTNMPQNVGSLKDLTSKIYTAWVDTLNSAKLIVLRSVLGPFGRCCVDVSQS